MMANIEGDWADTKANEVMEKLADLGATFPHDAASANASDAIAGAIRAAEREGRRAGLGVVH